MNDYEARYDCEVGTCATCLFYNDHDATDYNGQCRRMPPTGMRQWPLVKNDDWCGEYKTTAKSPNAPAQADAACGVSPGAMGSASDRSEQ